MSHTIERPRAPAKAKPGAPAEALRRLDQVRPASTLSAGEELRFVVHDGEEPSEGFAVASAE
jgi:hypothetical protein